MQLPADWEPRHGQWVMVSAQLKTRLHVISNGMFCELSDNVSAASFGLPKNLGNASDSTHCWLALWQRQGKDVFDRLTPRHAKLIQPDGTNAKVAYGGLALDLVLVPTRIVEMLPVLDRDVLPQNRLAPGWQPKP